MKSKPLLRLTVEKLAFGGSGIARNNGRVVFVPLSAPGDELEVTITESKKDYDFAEIRKILTPSPLRVQPPCPIYGVCGGCDLQHIAYSDQVNIKRELLREFFADENVEEFVTSPNEFAYRNRIQMHKDGSALGFRKRKSHDLVEVRECLIAESSINKKISSLKSLANGRYEITAEEATLDNEEGFSQVNTEVNKRLVQNVVEQIKAFAPKEILELYSGDGNFSAPILSQWKGSYTTVELDQRLVKKARARFTENQQQVNSFCANVDTFIRRFQFSNENSLLFVDPPRAGLSDAARLGIVALKPPIILYVSCDPATLRRDIRHLKQHSYKVLSLRGFDMFPQTHHIETLAVLQIDRKS